MSSDDALRSFRPKRRYEPPAQSQLLLDGLQRRLSSSTDSPLETADQKLVLKRGNIGENVESFRRRARSAGHDAWENARQRMESIGERRKHGRGGDDLKGLYSSTFAGDLTDGKEHLPDDDKLRRNDHLDRGSIIEYIQDRYKSDAGLE